MQYNSIRKDEWDKTLEQLLLSYAIFASINDEYGQDYELIGPSDINRISYNKPKPATPLKSFFLPVKENVTSERSPEKPRIIIGVPNCDIEGLRLLDSIYLDGDFNDIFYRQQRENTILISSDCFGIQENCHCMAYNIKPYSTEIADLSVALMNGSIILKSINDRGDDFIKMFKGAEQFADNDIISAIDKKHKETEAQLKEKNRDLPDYEMTGRLIENTGKEIWEKYSSDCVSCGACTTICPTCTCFLLIDKPGFAKVKQMDACQYPGFERMAGGEDPLHELYNRFRNRYMCKYLWKPRKFKSLACTGCGRCIEACIGKINKNELFKELAK
jgi:sulfhydrogenase subunit beta (sulfur reductase)